MFYATEKGLPLAKVFLILIKESEEQETSDTKEQELEELSRLM